MPIFAFLFLFLFRLGDRLDASHGTVNPYTSDIPLEIIFLMWLISSAALIILGVFRKKILK